VKGKKMKIILSAFISVVAIALAGCVSRSGSSGYVNEEALVFDRPETLTQSERSRLVVDVVGRLLTDPTFSAKYAEKMNAKSDGKMPIVAFSALENNVNDGRSDSAAMGQFTRELMVALRKTGKFDVIDDVANPALVNRLMSGNDAGETVAAAQNFGDYAPPDFYVTGDIRRFFDDGIYTHCLNLQMLDTSTRRVFWSDTAKILKRK
jgi:hypothetical protein